MQRQAFTLTQVIMIVLTLTPPSLKALEGFPTFDYDRVVIEPSSMAYNPTGEFIFPSIIRASDHFSIPLGVYYLYYAPHNNPGGICLAYADNLEGPWTGHPANPVISNVWSPHYSAAHVSSPHAFWNSEAQKLYLYFHGENDITRVASSTDGINFTYEKVCAGRPDFDNVTEVSYARVFEYTIPAKGNDYIMLLMCTYGSNPGIRAIYLAWSDDCLNWTTQRTPIIWPDSTEAGQISSPHFFPWKGKYYVVYHSSAGDMHVTEVGADFQLENHLGVFHNSMAGAPDNNRSAAPSFYTLDETMYMFYEAGQRGGTKIALAKSAVVVPAAPSSLTATAVSSVQINLAWMDNSGNETGFKIERATSMSGPFTLVATVGTNSTTYADESLSGDITYYYRVLARNGAGDSDPSNTASATTPPGGATLVLLSVASHDGWVEESAVDSNVGGSSSGASLRTGDNADRQIKAIVSFDTSSIPDGATVVSATLTMKRSGGSGGNPFDTLGTCYVDIRGGTGFNDSPSLGASDFQATADATQVTALSRPTATTGNLATGTLNATGRGYINTTGYTQLRVYFSSKNDGDGGNDYLAWYSGEAATVADRPVLELSYIDEPSTPPAPTGLEATAVSSSQIDLAWTASADATSYNVKRATTSGGTYTTIASGVTDTSYSDSDLTPVTIYYYVVSAVNSAGESANSAEASATTDAAPPPAPTGLEATAVSSSQIDLAWTTSADATSYNVKRATTSGGTYTTIASGVTDTSHSDSDLTPSTTYYYVVSAVNSAGESADSAEASATTDANTTTVTFIGVAPHDGWVRETFVNSDAGGATGGSPLRAGDDRDKQLKAFVSFDTSSLPEGATIVSATLRLKAFRQVGGNPFETLGTCYVDIKGGYGFNGSTSLEKSDFQATADATEVAELSEPTGSNGSVSTGALNSTGLSRINTTGYTQLRVYFSSKHDGDGSYDSIEWFAGGAETADDRPVLEVIYR